MKNLTYIFILFFANLGFSQEGSVKDTIYVDSTQQVIIYAPVKVMKNLETEIKEEIEESKLTADLDEEETETKTSERVGSEIQRLEKTVEDPGMSSPKSEISKKDLNTELVSPEKDVIESTIAVEQVKMDTIDGALKEVEIENAPDQGIVENVIVNEESIQPDKDFELIHKTNRILVWRCIKRFMYFSDLKYDFSTGVSRSMENFRDLFQNNAVIYHDLMGEPEHVDFRDYFDDISEYFDNIKIDQEFEDVRMVYNRLFQTDLQALETEANYSDEDQSSFYYELPIKKYISNKIGDDGKIIRLDEPVEYNLRFKILVDYQQLEARIAGIYLN